MKERIRIKCYQLPFTPLPRILVRLIGMEVTRKINFVLSKCGVRKHCSLCILIGYKNTDYKKYCQHIIVEYIQGKNKINSKNTNEVHILDCIYLKLLTNVKNSHNLLYLVTNRIENYRKVMPLTMIDSAIFQAYKIETVLIIEKIKINRGIILIVNIIIIIIIPNLFSPPA